MVLLWVTGVRGDNTSDSICGQRSHGWIDELNVVHERRVLNTAHTSTSRISSLAMALLRAISNVHRERATEMDEM